MGSSDDACYLALTQHILHGNHCNGHPLHPLHPSVGRQGSQWHVAVCYLPQCGEQLLEQLPAAKLLNNQPVFNQAAVR